MAKQTFTTIAGQCPKHGGWTRNCEAATAHLLKGKCPHCENIEQAPQRVSFDLVGIQGECTKHGMWTNRVMPSHVERLKSSCPYCTIEAVEVERSEEVRAIHVSSTTSKQGRIKELLGSSGIPRRFQARTFDNYRVTVPEQQQALDRARNYASKFPRVMERGASMIFYGPPGTGKTHLACAIANQAIREFGASALFTTVFEMLQQIKASYGSGATKSEAQVMALYAEVDLLVLDEIGVQLGTEYEGVMITDIINRRYSDMRPTIILSNLDQKGLGKFLGERVLDRMTEGGGGIVAFNWSSYRGQVLDDPDLPKGDYKTPDWL